MTAQAQAVLDAALALSESERAQLVERLLDTLSNEKDPLTDDELAAELDRRRTEVEQGVVKPVPWSQVRFR